jgi:hypothetical protein
MKRATLVALLLLGGIVCTESCKKSYHCTCTYDNNVVYTKDLGLQVKDKATEQCSSYDTTITGEKWNCQIY